MRSKRLAAAILAAHLAACLAACSSKDETSAVPAATAASLASLPATVEGRLNYEPGNDDEDADGTGDLYGSLDVGGQQIEVMIPQGVAAGAGLEESGELRVRATIAGPAEGREGVYVLGSLQKL